MSLGLSVTLVSRAKTAEPIVTPFGLRTRVGPGNHTLDGGLDPIMGRGNFEGEKGHPIVKYMDTRHSVVVYAKTAETTEIPFWLRTLVGQGNHVLDGGPDPLWEGAILRGGGASHCKV